MKIAVALLIIGLFYWCKVDSLRCIPTGIGNCNPTPRRHRSGPVNSTRCDPKHTGQCNQIIIRHRNGSGGARLRESQDYKNSDTKRYEAGDDSYVGPRQFQGEYMPSYMKRLETGGRSHVPRRGLYENDDDGTFEIDLGKFGSSKRANPEPKVHPEALKLMTVPDEDAAYFQYPDLDTLFLTNDG